MTFDEAERLIQQLPIDEQLRLIARLCERLSYEHSRRFKEKSDAERTAEADAWLAACDAFVESQPDPVDAVDSAELLRQIREERADRR